jgi:hypothetical protein
VKLLDKLGFTVFAGCLNPDGEGAAALKTNCSENIHIVKLDVTKPQDIRQARAYVDKIHEETGCGEQESNDTSYSIVLSNLAAMHFTLTNF